MRSNEELSTAVYGGVPGSKELGHSGLKELGHFALGASGEVTIGAVPRDNARDNAWGNVGCVSSAE